MIKSINSKGKPGRRPHKKKSVSEIGSKGFLRPKIRKNNKGKDISRRRVHAERHGILWEMSFWSNGAKKCYYPTAPFIIVKTYSHLKEKRIIQNIFLMVWYIIILTYYIDMNIGEI